MRTWKKKKRTNLVNLFQKEEDKQMFFFLIEELGPWIMQQADLSGYTSWCTKIVNDKSWF